MKPSDFKRIADYCAKLKIDEEQVSPRSKHYMAWIGNQECVVALLTKTPQKSRTTVHHMEYAALGKKGPDFYTLPVEANKHLSDAVSIDQMGQEAFRKKVGLPPLEMLALAYLGRYITQGLYLEPFYDGRGQRLIEVETHLRHSAPHYALALYHSIAD